MEFKGTKWPWRVRSGHGLMFVESPKENLGTPYGQEILADDYFNEDKKIHDCNLVAAAPELLEALQECKKLIDAIYTSDYSEANKPNDLRIQVESAIKKALGNGEE